MYRVAEQALQVFNKLPRGCLPSQDEWTVYSAIILEDSNDWKVIAMGTGTKCLSRIELSPRGDLLNDSHAEVIAIRSFKRYLLNEMRSPSDLIFNGSIEDGFELKDHIKFHFFTTHVPCGDATIFPKPNEENEEPVQKKSKLEENNFTGAKLIGLDEGADVLSQDIGAVRTKPGRGCRTLSMSCSDKIAKWLIMGVQGCLIRSLLKKPIYLNSITLAKDSGCQIDSLQRALWERFQNLDGLDRHIPIILQSSIAFPFPKDDSKSPCPKSIIWTAAVAHKPLEISVDGRRQGVAKKNISKPSSRLKISRIELFRNFLELLKLKYPNDVLHTLTYRAIQEKYCKEYLLKWRTLKTDYFKVWSDKPTEMKNFTVN